MNSGKWGTGKYLESLHRTYGKPLPKRDDGQFERALEFRMREKEEHAKTQQENDHLRYLLQRARQDHDQLLSDASDVMSAWDSSISKLKEYERRFQLSNTVKEDAEVHTTSGSSNLVHEHKDASRSTDASVSSARKGRSKGRDNEVPGEVLSADVPDTRGHAEEHADEGRQPEEGAVQ